MTLSFNYKRNKYGSIAERKSRASLRGDTMWPMIHFNPDHTSAPMVDRVATRMVVNHSVQEVWYPENFDVISAFLCDKCKNPKPLYIR